MFLVFNKEKIYAYIVSIVTVGMLFCMASAIPKNTESIETNADATKKVPIYNVQTDENKIAFTMNCAWNADDIDSILQTLQDNNTQITFFLVGDWIDKYPEAVKKIYESGNEIGLHSNTHPHVNKLSYEENLKEIEECNNKVEAITGQRSNLYRAPYGEYNDTVITSAEDNGYYVIQWSADTLDYEGVAGAEMWSRIESKLEKGSIILSHNGTKHTADSLDMLIKNIKSKGYEIVKVSDLIYKEDYSINSNGTQIKENNN